MAEALEYDETVSIVIQVDCKLPNLAGMCFQITGIVSRQLRKGTIIIVSGFFVKYLFANEQLVDGLLAEHLCRRQAFGRTDSSMTDIIMNLIIAALLFINGSMV